MYRDHPQHGRNIQMRVYAAAQYRSAAAESPQRRMLADPRIKAPDERVPLLVAPAERGDDRAADALYDWTMGELARFAAGDGASVQLSEVIPNVRSRAVGHQIARSPLRSASPTMIPRPPLEPSRRARVVPKSAHGKSAPKKTKTSRCWAGYEPTPGKKPGTKGSCKKKKKKKKK